MKTMLLFLIGPFLVLNMSNTSATTDSTCIEPYDELVKLSKSMSSVLKIQQIKDVQQFCRVNGLRDFEEFSAVHIHKDLLNDFKVNNDWIGSFTPSLESREKLFYNKITSKEASLVESVEPLKPEEINNCSNSIRNLKLKEMQQGDIVEATTMKSAFFCKDVTIAQIVSCSNSVKKLIQLSRPVSDINLVDIWSKVLSDPIYIKVMKEVALKNYEIIKSNKTPNSRFFDDIYNSFNEKLKDSNKATDFTYNLLGVLASNGNNTHNYIPCDVSRGIEVTIEMLNLGSVVLDRRTAQQGFLYTYPKEVNSLCDYGKNYHFWMSAFLAREASKETGNITASAAAAFTLNKGYQFMKEGGGRDPRKAFTSDIFSNYNNNMRLDLAQSAAGAWFGATSTKKRTGNLDRETFERGLVSIFEGSEETPRKPDFKFPSSKEPIKLIEAYSEWKVIMNPDSAFKYYEKVMNP